MRRNEFTSSGTYFEPINPHAFGGKLRACTNSIFCAGAWKSAKETIAEKAKVSLRTVREQALPLTGTPIHPVNLGNYNLKGTGEAYRALIHDGILEIKDGHANTVKTI